MKFTSASLVFAASLGVAHAVSIGKSGKVIARIDSNFHASGRFTLPTLLNGRTAPADIVQIPAADFVAAIVKVSSQADIDALQKTAGVVRIYEDKEIPGPTRPAALSAQDDAIPDANLAHKITGVLEARKQYGVSGKGIKVGVIDSGLDWKHPAFGAGTSFPTPRVPFGYDFVGDKYQSGLEPVEDNDPMDCGGHGTHCAGIIGANSTSTYIFTGVAPEVTFGAYRVFGCSGSTDTSIIVKAIERAFADGMDIISMSLGSNGGFPSGLDVDLINKLTDTGKVVFTIAQGNGQSGLIWQSSNPAIASQSIAVAATNNFAKVRTRGITVNGKKFNLTVYDDAAVPVSFTGDITLNTLAAPAPGAASNSDGCIGTANAVGANTNPKGKVLLIRRGTCVFTEKGQQAQAGGAVAVIVYNHGLSAQPALYDFTSDPSTNITIPFYTMDAQSGSALAAHLLTTSGSSKLAFDAQDTASVTPEITVTTFTSWGPGPDLSFKPDVAAPGNNILSTIPLAQGGFGLKSGTSMATPYTAGIIALYLQYAKQISGNPTTSTVTTVVGGYSTISGGGATTTPGVTQSPVKCIPRPTTTAAPAYGRRLTRRADSPALLSKLFDRNPIFIRDRLQNAGKPLVLGTTGELETAVLQGGGLIQVPKLFATRVSAVPGKFALGSFQSAQQHTLTVTNYDSAAQTVVVGSVSALAVDITNANAPGYIKALNPITFAVGGSAGSESVQVILAPGESKAVTVSFVPSADIVATNKDKKTIVLVSGWITVSANGIVNNAAYSGLIGDITNAVYHEDTPSGLQNAGIFPSPGWLVNGASSTSTVNTSLANLKDLTAVVRLIVPAGNLTAILFDGESNPLGTVPALSGSEFSRNYNDNTAAATYQYQIKWANLTYVPTGSITPVPLKSGTYQVGFEFTYVKAFNEPTAFVSKDIYKLPKLIIA